jgi:hypothetical protein
MEERNVMNMRNLILVSSGLALALSLPGSAMADLVNLNASLDGASETNGGDPDGSGSFFAEVGIETGDVCYKLAVVNIGDAMAAHIHEGAAGEDGKPVASVSVTGPEDDVCMAAEPDTLALIAATPGNYYVNVHTKDFPAGAIRGQLVNPAAPTPAEAATPAEATTSDEATAEAPPPTQE